MCLASIIKDENYFLNLYSISSDYGWLQIKASLKNVHKSVNGWVAVWGPSPSPSCLTRLKREVACGKDENSSIRRQFIFLCLTSTSYNIKCGKAVIVLWLLPFCSQPVMLSAPMVSVECMVPLLYNKAWMPLVWSSSRQSSLAIVQMSMGAVQEQPHGGSSSTTSRNTRRISW